MSATELAAGAALGVWLYLIALRGRFWRCTEGDAAHPAVEPEQWPAVVAIVPARNEAGVIEASLGSLLAQDYPGAFDLVLVDDGSEDGTADRARSLGARERLTILSGAPPPGGWTGKMWAVQQGLDHLAHADHAPNPAPKYVLLTDADIAHTPRALRSLVARAEAGGLLLTSRMVRLRCVSLAERALIPAFVFFFQMLYPFAWVNRHRSTCAAAAGGCMLVAYRNLIACGGVASIRDALIDDCALARRLKAQGPIWLGLTDYAASIRAYPRFGDIRRMVARSAYAQLSYSPAMLLGALAGLGLTFVAPILLATFGSGSTRLAALAAWALMTLAYWPSVRFYRLTPLWAPLLPAVAAVYMLLTVDSAYQHMRRRGGMWKGRAQALPAKGQ